MPEHAHPPTGGRVVIVEDHAVVRAHLVDLLEAAGLEVVAAAGTMAEGRDRIVALRPDVAVLDNRLPDGRGVDLGAVIVRELPGVAVVIHSGVVTPEEEDRARAAGIAEIVPKSVRGSTLLDAVHRHLPRSAARA